MSDSAESVYYRMYCRKCGEECEIREIMRRCMRETGRESIIAREHRV